MSTDETKNRDNDPQIRINRQDEVPQDTENAQSVLLDHENSVEVKDDDDRPVKNANQQGFGIDDGPNQPLSREMLTDLQDAGQQDLQRQREEEKRENK